MWGSLRLAPIICVYNDSIVKNSVVCCVYMYLVMEEHLASGYIAYTISCKLNSLYKCITEWCLFTLLHLSAVKQWVTRSIRISISIAVPVPIHWCRSSSGIRKCDFLFVLLSDSSKCAALWATNAHGTIHVVAYWTPRISTWSWFRRKGWSSIYLNINNIM